MIDDPEYFVCMSTRPERVRGKTRWILNTEEERQKAIREGYQWQSFYAYEYAPSPDKPMPFMQGDLNIVFRLRSIPELALLAMREFAWEISKNLDIPCDMFRFYMDTAGTATLSLLSELFGSESSHLLYYRHGLMVQTLCKFLPEYRSLQSRSHCAAVAIQDSLNIDDLIDWRVFATNPEIFFLAPGLDSGRIHSLQISPDELFARSEADIFQDVLDNIKKPITETLPELIPSLDALYGKSAFGSYLNAPTEVLAASLKKCPFCKLCLESPEKLKPEQLDLAIGIYTLLHQDGRKRLCELPRLHSHLSKELARRIYDSYYFKNIPACSDIKEVFACDQHCQVQSPIELASKEKSQTEKMAHFKEQPDGVYFYPPSEDEESEIIGQKICSPLFIRARIRNQHSEDWGKLVSIIAADGHEHLRVIRQRDCTGSMEDVCAGLMGAGLEVESQKYTKLLKSYIFGAKPEKLMLSVDSTGWHNDCYILPDASYGKNSGEVYYTGSVGVFKISGDLEDWVQHIGLYCRDNPLLIFVVCYALTGPLLQPCHMESGGLNIYGPSSTGKTTIALLAGSVCGGSTGRGYIQQWNTTGNALEKLASTFQDGLLVLDEIGQAFSATLGNLIYVLANERGKTRLKADTSLREPLEWTLSFLSTGEKKVQEKIEEGGKTQVMAGQCVRVIDLPIINPDGQGAFRELHGKDSPASLSSHIRQASSKYYGTLLRAFLRALFGNEAKALQQNIHWLKNYIEQFVKDNSPKGADGQVIRVIRKFALIEACGIFTARHSLVPWSESAVSSAVHEQLKTWLAGRGTLISQEVENAINRIKDFISVNWHNAFLDVDANLSCLQANAGEMVFSTSTKKSGYRWDTGKYGKCVFIITEALRELYGGADKGAVERELDKRGYLLHTATGSIMTTKSVQGANHRGLGFLPMAWLGRADESKAQRTSIYAEASASIDSDDESF